MQSKLFGVAAVIAATALLVGSVALLVRSAEPALAQDFGPVVTGGVNPWLSWTGPIPVTSDVDLYTVPTDRVLVVTGATTHSDLVNLYEVTPALGDVLRVSGFSMAMVNNGGNDATSMFPINEGRLVLQPGSTLRLRNNSGYEQNYYLQGYLAQP